MKYEHTPINIQRKHANVLFMNVDKEYIPLLPVRGSFVYFISRSERVLHFLFTKLYLCRTARRRADVCQLRDISRDTVLLGEEVKIQIRKEYFTI